MKTISKILSIVLVLSLVLGFALVGTAAETTLATFTFPTSSNTGSWQDGNQMATGTEFTSGSYTLTFNNCTKVYSKGNDAAGRGFIKFGTSSDPGTLTFTVPGDVTRVELQLAGYKAKTSKYTINDGSAVTISTQASQTSAASPYDVVSIDTSSNKTVTVASVSGAARMVMFSVIYYGGTSTAPSCEHTNATYTKTMAGHTMDCPDCDDSFTAQNHTYTDKVCSVCGYELYTPAHMDKVTIYYPAGDCYMSGTASGSKLAAGTALELIVVVDGSNYKFVNADGKYLTSGATGNGLSLTTTATEYSLWALEEADNGWYIKNVNAAYNNNPQYIEYYNGFTTFSLYSGGAIYTYLFEKTGVATEIPEFQCPHVDADSDYICDNGCGENVDPAADSALTLEQANALGEAHSNYTTNKYYVTGVITEIVKSDYGNLWIEDEDGNKFYIYGIYSADGSTRYDALDTIPGVGDEVTLYGVIGQYNGAAQMKNAWLDELVVHTCDDADNDHKCDICDATVSDCEDDDNDHKCDICDANVSDCGTDTDKDHECDICGEEVGDHTVDDDNDHKCDYCDATISECDDADGDHKCDTCDTTVSECEFNSADFITTKDGHSQSCTCGEVGDEEPHVDADGDYICDVCEYELDVPKTGDISLLPAVIMAVLSASGMGLIIKKKVF